MTEFIKGMIAAAAAVVVALILILVLLYVLKQMSTAGKTTDSASTAGCTVQSVKFDERSLKLNGKQTNGKPCANNLLYDAKTVVQVGTTKTNPSALAAAKSITYDLPKATAKDPPTGTAKDPATTPAAKITVTTGGTPDLTFGSFDIAAVVDRVAAQALDDDPFSAVKGVLDFQGNVETWKTNPPFDVGDCRISTMGFQCSFFPSANLSNQLFKTVNSALKAPPLKNVMKLTMKTVKAPDGSTQEIFSAVPQKAKSPSITVTLSPSILTVDVNPLTKPLY